MLIKKANLQILYDNAYIRKISQAIMEEYQFMGLPPPDTHRRDRIARHCLDISRQYGMNTERSVVTFALHMININPEFHRQEAIQAILQEEDDSPSARLEAIVRDVSDAQWDEAENMTDPVQYWEQVLKVVS